MSLTADFSGTTPRGPLEHGNCDGLPSLGVKYTEARNTVRSNYLREMIALWLEPACTRDKGVAKEE